MSDKFKNSFFSIAAFSKEFMRKHEDQYQRYEVLSSWERVVGKSIARFSRIVKYEFSTLYITSSDSLWLSELHLAKEKILEKYRKAYPKLYFNDLRIFFDRENPEENKKVGRFLRERGLARRKAQDRLLEDFYPGYEVRSDFLDWEEKNGRKAL